jgi:hypothetical protein
MADGLWQTKQTGPRMLSLYTPRGFGSRPSSNPARQNPAGFEFSPALLHPSSELINLGLLLFISQVMIF